MAILRYSAQPVFGVPILGDLERLGDADVEKMMQDFGIEGEPVVDRGPVDITPAYWSRTAARYMLSLAHPEGPAVVDYLLTVDGGDVLAALPDGRGGVSTSLGVRQFKIPDDALSFAVVGSGPRHPEPSIHELIVYKH